MILFSSFKYIIKQCLWTLHIDVTRNMQYDRFAFRLIKSLTPDAFTFILEATKEVPRRLQHPKKKTIGVCIPKNAIAQKLVEELDEPLMTTTLILPPDTDALTDPYDIRQRLDDLVDLIIDAGEIQYQPTTIIDCTAGSCTIVRQGKGIATTLE